MEEAREKKKPCTRIFAVAETHYSPCKRVLEGAIMGCPRTALGIVDAEEEKNQKMELDHLKKMQCSMTLKMLMVHPDGWPFKKPAIGKAFEVQDYSDIVSKPLLYLETIKWKLEKSLYKKTDQFAGDIRILFCNAMLHYPKKHEVHKIAVKLSDLFEKKWKSFGEKWDAKKAKGEEEKSKPLERVKEVSVDVKACGSVTHKVGKKRKLSNEENMYLDCSTCHLPSKVSTLKKEKDLIHQIMTPSDPELSIGEAKKHFLDSILTSQSSLLCGKVDLVRKKRMKSAQTNNYLFSCSVDLQRKNKEREAARMMLQRTERTVFIDDNLDSFEELERLCGCSLADCRRVNPLKEILGLALKDEFTMLSSSDEEKFLSRDWEEGEIISFD